MRYVFRIGFALALGLALMAGCSDENGEGGSGGTGGIDLCEGVTCEDDGNECTGDGVCNPEDRMCEYTPVEDGTPCSEGECVDGVCARIGAFPCTEQGIRDAIAEGGGPHFFACDGPTTVVTEAEIVIANDVILDGEGNLTVDGQQMHRVFSVAAEITSELRGFTVSHGSALGEFFPPPDGGGILNQGTLTLTDSTVSDNASDGGGGGILNQGTLTVTHSTVSGNTAAADLGGGGIRNQGTLTVTHSTVSGNTARQGGGISTDSGNTVLTNSTVSGNTAGAGGGIFNLLGTLTVTNSTVSGNTAELGGAIANLGDLTLTNSTVSDNPAPEGIFQGGADFTVANSLVGGDCLFGDGSGGVTSNGYNIESPGDTCGFDQATDQVYVTAEQLALGPLQDNGGPTMTHALLAEPTVSVAIDQIPEADCVDADGQPLTTDQRGEPRPETGGTMCDVGAFELQP